MTTASKSELRSQARALREGVEFEAASREIEAQLAGWERFQKANSIFGFRGRGHEVNLEGLRTRFPKKHWYFPRVQPEGQMDFYRVTPESQWTTNDWGILEPSPETPRWEQEQGFPDLVLVPALLADGCGHRLGFGGGYYDRFLSILPQSVVRLCPIPAVCLVQTLPAEAWDVSMHVLVTESRVLLCPIDD